jgi:hypothetical protein
MVEHVARMRVMRILNFIWGHGMKSYLIDIGIDGTVKVKLSLNLNKLPHYEDVTLP